jgi:hypothetical protein
MNADNPPPDDFEQQLAEFSPAPLPEDWKDELIGNAVSSPSTGDRKIVAFSLFQKISLSGIAAAWVAIAFLRLTMPANEADSGANLAESSEHAAQPDVPLLVRYIEQRNAFTRQF